MWLCFNTVKYQTLATDEYYFQFIYYKTHNTQSDKTSFVFNEVITVSCWQSMSHFVKPQLEKGKQRGLKGKGGEEEERGWGMGKGTED